MAVQTPVKATPPARARSVAEIQADIATSREHLVETITELQVAVRRTIDPKRILAVQVTRVKSHYVDEYGGVRPDRVAITVGVVVGFVVVRRVGKRAFGHSR